MSVVNSQGAQVRLDRGPAPTPAYSPKGGKVRRRNLRWLAYKRQFNLSIDELAEDLNCDRSTAARAVRSAEVEEARSAAAGVLDEDFILDIQQDYPIGSEVGDHPDVRAFFAARGIPQFTREQLREQGRSGHHSRRREHTNTVSDWSRGRLVAMGGDE